MIAVVSDKFKGTLTSREVAAIVGDVLGDCVYVPMADGGEGTAEALGCVHRGDYYSFTDIDGQEAGYVPSCGEGIAHFPDQEHVPLRERTSAPVGLMVAEALRHYDRVYVGIGGTRMADGGVGFAEALRGCSGSVIGLADVSAPLVADSGISALSFLAQKGATDEDVRVLRKRYEALKRRYPTADRFGAAGGGIGFAIESILGGRVIPGAPYVLRRNLKAYLGNRRPDLIVTGEGCVDEQTSAGKVVAAVNAYGREHGIPVVTFAGIVKGNPPFENVFPTTHPGAALPTREEAAVNLRRTVAEAYEKIKKLMI